MSAKISTAKSTAENDLENVFKTRFNVLENSANIATATAFIS